MIGRDCDDLITPVRLAAKVLSGRRGPTPAIVLGALHKDFVDGTSFALLSIGVAKGSSRNAGWSRSGSESLNARV
jgi:hypothetical protein